MSAKRHPMISRVLATLAPLLVALTIWVPIQTTGGDHVFPDVRLLSGTPFFWALVLGSAIGLAALFWAPWFKAWVRVAVLACAVFIGSALPYLGPTGGCWDGIDSEGRPIGNCVTSMPWFGMAALLGAGAAMIITTVAASTAQRRPPTDQFRRHIPPAQR